MQISGLDQSKGILLVTDVIYVSTANVQKSVSHNSTFGPLLFSLYVHKCGGSVATDPKYATLLIIMFVIRKLRTSTVRKSFVG